MVELASKLLPWSGVNLTDVIGAVFDQSPEVIYKKLSKLSLVLL
jgi:hypothetical protein